jgi:putative ABC transport system substrate-binding protein
MPVSRFVGILLVACGLVMPSLASAQRKPLPRVGILDAAGSPSGDAFVRGLKELGYVDGRNVVIERSTVDTAAHLPTAVADLVKHKVDVIFAPSAVIVKAARDATSTIPIVFAGVADPVKSGFAASLARPGGNITGLGALNVELGTKRLQLLKEAIPGLAKVGYLHDRGDTLSPLLIPDMEAAARALGLGFHTIAVKRAEALDRAFTPIVRYRIGAVVTGGSLYSSRSRIAQLAMDYRVPIMGDSRPWVESGALLAYGVSYEDLARRAAGHVDRILKGARPGDLPIDRPTRFELFVNLKIAKIFGLTLPSTLLTRADKLIE